MIVERRTFLAKQWQEHKVAEILKKAMELNSSSPTGYRIYVFQIGPINEVVLEMEGEDLQEWQQKWDRALSNPDMLDYMKQITDLTERGGTSEI